MTHRPLLLVEDDPSDIDLTRRALGQSHVANELVVAADGQQALDYVFAQGEFAGRDPNDVPALVLLDLKLPRINGFEVLRRIRADERTRRIPVVVLTSSSEEQDMARSYDLGVNSYIRKPVDFSRFVESVQQLGLYWLLLNEAPPPSRTR